MVIWFLNPYILYDIAFLGYEFSNKRLNIVNIIGNIESAKLVFTVW